MSFYRIYEVRHKNLPVEMVFAANQKIALAFCKTTKICKENGWVMKGIRISRLSSYGDYTEGGWSRKIEDGGFVPQEVTLIKVKCGIFLK